MIIIEYLWKFIRGLFYCITRPIIWLLTARDCARCKHLDGYGNCTIPWSKRTKCRQSVHRSYFNREFWFK